MQRFIVSSAVSPAVTVFRRRRVKGNRDRRSAGNSICAINARCNDSAGGNESNKARRREYATGENRSGSDGRFPETIQQREPVKQTRRSRLRFAASPCLRVSPLNGG